MPGCCTLHHARLTALCTAVLSLLAACDTAISGAREPAPDEVGEHQAMASPFEIWRPANGQAEAITGNLTSGASDGRSTFAFAKGVTIWAEPAQLPLNDAEVRALVRDVQQDLGVAADVFPTFFEVREERVAMSAPQGGLCGGMRARWIAMARAPDEGEGESLRLVAYHGSSMEVVTLAAARRRLDPARMHLCFAFDFARVGES